MCTLRRKTRVVMVVLVFSSSEVETFSSSSDAVGVVRLDLAAAAPDMGFGSSGFGLRQNLEVSCMSGTDTTRNQYSFLNMPSLQSLLSTLLAKPFHTRSNHIRPTQRLDIHEDQTSTTVQSSFRSIQSISASMHVFAFMRKLDGRKHTLRAQVWEPVELEMSYIGQYTVRKWPNKLEKKNCSIFLVVWRQDQTVDSSTTSVWCSPPNWNQRLSIFLLRLRHYGLFWISTVHLWCQDPTLTHHTRKHFVY